MPRQARIDTPGGLHHIMVRGIERQDIFRDDLARDYVLGYFGKDRKTAQRRYRDYVLEGVGQGRRPDLVGGGLIQPRSVFCYWAVREPEETATSVARKLGLTQSGVSRAVSREGRS
jgi:hypothetical protein